MPDDHPNVDAECDGCGIGIARSHPINIVIKKEEVLVLCSNCDKKHTTGERTTR